MTLLSPRRWSGAAVASLALLTTGLGHAQPAPRSGAHDGRSPPASCAQSWPDGPPSIHRAPACVGLAVGNDPQAFASAAAWSRGIATAVTVFTGQASWSDFDGSVGYEINLWSARPETRLWSIPLIVRGATLSEAAAGDYDAHYRTVAAALAAAYPQGVIFVRTGWEFNGDWMPWSAIKQPDAYRLAFRHFVLSFRGVSNRFVFTWAPNVGDVGMDPALAYPGDDVVDIVGMDAYWQPGDPPDPAQAWSYTVDRPYGLRWLEAFAAAHGKPTAYPEWGVRGDNAAPFIAGAAKWFSRHAVAYQSYWDSNDNYPGKLSDGREPDSAGAYLAAFSRIKTEKK